MNIFLQSLGFKNTENGTYVLENQNNIETNLRKLLITNDDITDVNLPGTENAYFPRLVVEETKNKGIYTASAIRDDGDSIQLKNADLNDISVFVQSLINDAYLNEGYESPYVFEEISSKEPITSPFQGRRSQGDFLIDSTSEDGRVNVLQTPTLEYPNYDFAKSNFDYNIEPLFDKFVSEQEQSKSVNLNTPSL